MDKIYKENKNNKKLFKMMNKIFEVMEKKFLKIFL